MLPLVCLAIVWAAFLVPPVLRRHREGRPGSSVTSFRRQLSTLERATPGTTLRAPQPGRPAGAPVRRPAPARPAVSPEVVRRRRDVLVGLLGATGFTFLLFLVAAGPLTFLLFFLSGGALAAYCYALVQIRMRAEEAAHKVRVLRPARPAMPPATVRRTANG
jgi:hypothetical protein